AGRPAGRQLEAIAQWVDFGGRLLVLTCPSREDGLAKPEVLLPFLARLSRDHPQLTWTESPEHRVAELGYDPVCFFTGAGRTAVLQFPDQFSGDRRQRTVSYLMGVQNKFAQLADYALPRRESLDMDMPPIIADALLPEA